VLHPITAGVAAWFFASIPAAMLVGRFIRAGRGPTLMDGIRPHGGPPEPPEPPAGAMVPATPSGPAPAPVAAAA